MITIHDAVRAVYSNAVTIYGTNDVNTLEVVDANGAPITIVPETVTAKLTELQTAEEQKKQAAHDKLVALGLTIDDLKTLLG
jgi:hypothetical protein